MTEIEKKLISIIEDEIEFLEKNIESTLAGNWSLHNVKREKERIKELKCELYDINKKLK